MSGAPLFAPSGSSASLWSPSSVPRSCAKSQPPSPALGLEPDRCIYTTDKSNWGGGGGGGGGAKA